MNWATSKSTPAEPNCSSRSSPNERNAPASPSAPTSRSASGEPSSPIPAWSPRSWTESPSTPTSSRPAPSPTGYAPARPVEPRRPPDQRGITEVTGCPQIGLMCSRGRGARRDTAGYGGVPGREPKRCSTVFVLVEPEPTRVADYGNRTGVFSAGSYFHARTRVQ